MVCARGLSRKGTSLQADAFGVKGFGPREQEDARKRRVQRVREFWRRGKKEEEEDKKKEMVERAKWTRFGGGGEMKKEGDERMKSRRKQASAGPRLAFSHEGMCWPCHVSRWSVWSRLDLLLPSNLPYLPPIALSFLHSFSLTPVFDADTNDSLSLASSTVHRPGRSSISTSTVHVRVPSCLQLWLYLVAFCFLLFSPCLIPIFHSPSLLSITYLPCRRQRLDVLHSKLELNKLDPPIRGALLFFLFLFCFFFF